MSAELEFDLFESIKLMHYSHICTPVNCWYSVLFLCTNERRNSNVEPWSHAQGCCHRQSCTQKSIDIEFYVFTIKKIDTKNTQTESFAWSENLVICSKKYKYNVQTGFVSFNMILLPLWTVYLNVKLRSALLTIVSFAYSQPRKFVPQAITLSRHNKMWEFICDAFTSDCSHSPVHIHCLS